MLKVWALVLDKGEFGPKIACGLWREVYRYV
jgi:hypothetical protein